MAAKQEEKWKGSVGQVVEAPLDKTWEILADFNGLHTHFPKIFVVCNTIEGEKNAIGSIREVEVPTPAGTIVHVKEKLLALDNEKHTLKYSIVDNPHFDCYNGQIVAEKVETEKTNVVYSFEINPIAGGTFTEASYTSQYEGFVRAILTTLNNTLSQK